MGKIGLQVLAWVPGALDYVLRTRPKHLKVLSPDPGPLSIIKREIPDCFIVYRRYQSEGEQQALLSSPRQGAQWFAETILKETARSSGMIDAYEGLNETGLWEAADSYNVWTAEYARLMRFAGCKTIAYNFSTGTPSGYFQGDGNKYPKAFRDSLQAYWAHYFDGLRESDYLGLHEYASPTMQDAEGWLCLRYRRVWDILPADCRKPILITECGIDGGVIGRTVEESGWKAFCDEAEYLRQLQWYASEIAKDDYVLGAHIYQAGSADPRWDSFDVRGCERIADWIASQKREEKAVMPEFRFAFKDLADSAPEVVGEPASEQIDIPNAFSVQATSKGVLFYMPGVGAKFFGQTLPNA